MSVKFPAMSQFISAAEEWLNTNTSMPREQRQALAEIVPVLLKDCSDSGQKIFSVAGPPGTGKSTLAGTCAAALESERISSIVISLDDYYLPAADRQKLSRSEHPLFSVRGVPGTHDLDLLITHLEQLSRPDHEDILMPLFNKSIDDRLDTPGIVKAGFVPANVFIEGWIAGVPPQGTGALLGPVNEFEEEQDPDSEWRCRVNSYLYDYFHALDPFINCRWYLKAPDWESVIAWRWDQELNDQQSRFSSRL